MDSMRKIHSELLGNPMDTFTRLYNMDSNPIKGSGPIIYTYSYSLNDESYNRYRSFFFESPYNEKLDFIELLIDDQSSEIIQEITKEFNEVFKKQCLGYRIINGKITDIEEEEENQSVDEAVKHSPHIEKAITLLYDRESPDYENSVKESISAVEQVCKKIADVPNATLSGCIKRVELKTKLHPALKEALLKLYTYTSDESGIRHASLGNMNTSFEDAKFMLVIYSAFCNYLLEKKISS